MKIIWAAKAKHSYFEELDRINNFYTAREVEKFINLVDEVILNLKTGVLEGKVSKRTTINSFVISKQTTLFFDIDRNNSRIELLLFWRNKEDPKKLIKFLKESQSK